MKEPYREGVAIHSGPESCVVVRKDRGEALTGVRPGWALRRHYTDKRLLIQIHIFTLFGPTGGKQTASVTSDDGVLWGQATLGRLPLDSKRRVLGLASRHITG